MSEQAPLTFQDLATEGTMIARAPFSRERFDQLIQEINDRFGLSLTPCEDVHALLADRLRFVAGRYEQETQPLQRKCVRDRTIPLPKGAQRAAEPPQPRREGLNQGTRAE